MEWQGKTLTPGSYSIFLQAEEAQSSLCLKMVDGILTHWNIFVSLCGSEFSFSQFCLLLSKREIRLCTNMDSSYTSDY